MTQAFVMIAARQRFTFRDYVQLEEDAGVKHEFLDGMAWRRRAALRSTRRPRA